MRFSVDVGGTFTDLIVEDAAQAFRIYKAPTTPQNPVAGILDVIGIAAKDLNVSREALLGSCTSFLHATTISTNAILSGGTARTAFLTTEGHPDILLIREGGRREPFNHAVPYPDPYIPRSLTFEVLERIGPDGAVVVALDEQGLMRIVEALRANHIEAIGVCLLWSIVNPLHEQRIGEFLRKHLPDIPFTLSHELNPVIREYRRASSTCIDASLKPLMSLYLGTLRDRLREAGFAGRLLTFTSLGSVIDAAELARAPIHSIRSGPSMAPIAGRFFARADDAAETVIVADSGGTSYDVSLVRRGRIPWTQETWLGERLRGHMTGFPSVDVKSVGAGGGSIAWVDDGGMLHVGPKSAGSTPGPACYGKGGADPTVTDAAVVLGYIDPDYFLGGAMKLDANAAMEAIASRIDQRLKVGLHGAADAIMTLVCENMVEAIEDITVNQGIDPTTAHLVGGGGAGGLNAVRIAKRLGCSRIVIPAVGATLSAAGGLMSDLSREFSATHFTTSESFDFEAVGATLANLEGAARRFLAEAAPGSEDQKVAFLTEARYSHQVWEIEVPLRGTHIRSPADLAQLVDDFHALHEELFTIRDTSSPIEFVLWRARASSKLQTNQRPRVVEPTISGPAQWSRQAYFPNAGLIDTKVQRFEAMSPNSPLPGPAIVESSITTVVVDPGAYCVRTSLGSLLITLGEV